MQYIVAALTPAATAAEGDKRVSLAMASQMHILTTDDDIILSQSVISSSNVAMFWKQKLWNRLFTQLSQSAPISHLTSDHLLAICALARGVPVNVLQERLQMLVELVVQSMLRTQNSTGTDNTAESTLAAAALTVQSMCTLEMLLRAEPALFTSYLNIIIPAILKVRLLCHYCAVLYITFLLYVSMNRHLIKQRVRDCASLPWKDCWQLQNTYLIHDCILSVH